MNCKTISLPYNEAQEKFIEYRDAVRQHNRKEDAELMRGFKALSKGHKLIDVHDAMKFAGLNEKNQPKLAICRADATHCWCNIRRDGWAEFVMLDTWRRVRNDQRVVMPAGTFPEAASTSGNKLCAIVPSIPPRLRPKVAYSKLHILWEAEWEEVPTDPMLLRHLGGALYVVLACWDLTELERAVLKRAL
jgi:hypothetical protein